jgi:cation diffusion facilitator CzcD-associated flavoprotein CzcO
MYMLHSLRDKLDLNVIVFEAGDGVGGTWYWNRYPGARCDSDSYVYCYTFDKNLLQEWDWSERYPEQDEILRYLEHCAERFDLKPDIQFGKRVVEPTNSEALAGVRFGAHSGLKMDIAPSPKCANNGNGRASFYHLIGA